jgi:hypothetical protein
MKPPRLTGEADTLSAEFLQEYDFGSCDALLDDVEAAIWKVFRAKRLDPDFSEDRAANVERGNFLLARMLLDRTRAMVATACDQEEVEEAVRYALACCLYGFVPDVAARLRERRARRDGANAGNTSKQTLAMTRTERCRSLATELRTHHWARIQREYVKRFCDKDEPKPPSERSIRRYLATR